MISSNSHYEIGHSHRVCEDFALHGEMSIPSPMAESQQFSYGIVCDGCSSSLIQNGIRLPLNVDTGARILAIMAKQSLRELLSMDMSPSHSPKTFFIGMQNTMVAKSGIILNVLGLSTDVLDSTLVSVLAGKDFAWVGFWGDGVLAIKTKTQIILYIIEFESGAPYYLSYSIDKNRREAYKTEFIGKNKTIKEVKINLPYQIENVTTEIVSTDTADNPVFFDFTKKEIEEREIESISVLSDGLSTFRIGESDVRCERIISELLDFKSLVGEFVVKRFNLAKKRIFEPENITHYDDLAISTLLFKKDQ